MHEYRQANAYRHDERDVRDDRDDRATVPGTDRQFQVHEATWSPGSRSRAGVAGPEQRSQVPEEVERLGKAVARIREVIEHLQERLACVSVPLPHAGAAAENIKDAHMLCPLAERIGDEARRVEDGAAILGHLLRTLAL